MEIYSETDEDEDEIDGESTLFHKIYAYTTEICLQVCSRIFCCSLNSLFSILCLYTKVLSSGMLNTAMLLIQDFSTSNQVYLSLFDFLDFPELAEVLDFDLIDTSDAPFVTE